jgi:hypothetical protein
MQRSGGFQLIGPAQAWQISLHLWRGELDAAARRVADGLDRVAKAEPDLIYNAELYWLAVRVQADLVVDGGLDSGQRDGAEARASAALGDLDEVIAGIPGEGAPRKRWRSARWPTPSSPACGASTPLRPGGSPANGFTASARSIASPIRSTAAPRRWPSWAQATRRSESHWSQPTQLLWRWALGPSKKRWRRSRGEAVSRLAGTHA